MNRNDFTDLIKDTFGNVLDLNRKKGEEYAGAANVHANFERTSQNLGNKITPEQVLYIFMNKHLDAIASYCSKGRYFSNEPIEGRIDDAIVYLLLLKGMVVHKKSMDAAQESNGCDIGDYIHEPKRNARAKDKDLSSR